MEVMEATHTAEAAEAPPPYRVKEVAQMLRVSLATIYEEIARGALPAMSIGGAKRVEHDDFMAYKQRCRVKAVRTDGLTS
jgi:excisionase family DNA binding protein